ncbi:alpha-hydroxy acid oxidase [Corynebacterium glutamicum]|uniref:alpha-hydroxy acid oxidase n=1 Tax=Corynebacterium glutamicum TaxID=1718 RepID=UPI0009BE9400|nr:alpha-hydroxy acid oxidase [Corynebacterium glutamicum]
MEYQKIKRQFLTPKEILPLLQLNRFIANGDDRRLSNIQTISDLRKLAKRRTPAGPFNYVDGGADGEITMNRQEEFLNSIEFQPNVLRDVSRTSLKTDLFGTMHSLPIGFAPTGFMRMSHTLGEKAVANSAARHDIPFALSTMGTTSISDLSDAVPHGTKWFQLYLWKDRDRSRELIQEAKKHGYEALILTVDVPVAGNRLRDKVHGMTIPPSLTAKTFLDASYRPHWWINFLTTSPLSFAFTSADETRSMKELVADLYDCSVTFDDLNWIREEWDGKLIIKGIQTLPDAVRSFESGADAIILSNHGGRQLDRAPLVMELLPKVREALGPKPVIMVDSGFRTGADIVAALALGADFVWIGRPYLYGLMAAGEKGVDKVVEILTSEIERTLKLLGVASIAELSEDAVRIRSIPEPINRAGDFDSSTVSHETIPNRAF